MGAGYQSSHINFSPHWNIVLARGAANHLYKKAPPDEPMENFELPF